MDTDEDKRRRCRLIQRANSGDHRQYGFTNRHRVRISAVANFNNGRRHYAHGNGLSPRSTSSLWQRSTLFGRPHWPITSGCHRSKMKILLPSQIKIEVDDPVTARRTRHSLRIAPKPITTYLKACLRVERVIILLEDLQSTWRKQGFGDDRRVRGWQVNSVYLSSRQVVSSGSDIPVFKARWSPVGTPTLFERVETALDISSSSHACQLNAFDIVRSVHQSQAQYCKRYYTERN